MRLLSKNEVNGLKSKEKTMEIQEGAKLAKKIDILRETASREEANLLKFRTESLKNIREEIQAGILERDVIKSEVEALRAEKQKLLDTINSIKI